MELSRATVRARRGQAWIVITLGVIAAALGFLSLGLRSQPHEWIVPEGGTIRIPASIASPDDIYTCVTEDGRPYNTWGPMDLSARGRGVTASDGTGFGVDEDGSVGFRCGESDYQL